MSRHDARISDRGSFQYQGRDLCVYNNTVVIEEKDNDEFIVFVDTICRSDRVWFHAHYENQDVAAWVDIDDAEHFALAILTAVKLQREKANGSSG